MSAFQSSLSFFAFNIQSSLFGNLSCISFCCCTLCTDSVYSIDEIAIAENGTAIADLPRTLLHNFGGWYNGEEKVTTISGDVSLTAKWFDRADVTLNGETDIIDIVRLKKALADKSSDIICDIDRDNAVSATDATVLRKILLGIDVVTIGGNDIAAYTVTSGDSASF